MEDIFAEVGSSKPKGAKKLLPAMATTAFNCGGGVLAGRIDEAIYAITGVRSAATLVLVGLAVGLRVMFWSGSNRDSSIREIAAGMAGWSGDDLYILIKLLATSRTWKPGTAYRAGDRVRYGTKFFEALRDVPAMPREEPGNSRLWQEVAQGFHDLQQYRSAAQALISDDQKWKAISDRVLDEVGPHLEQTLGTELTTDEKIGLRDRMRSTLVSVVEDEL